MDKILESLLLAVAIALCKRVVQFKTWLALGIFWYGACKHRVLFMHALWTVHICDPANLLQPLVVSLAPTATSMGSSSMPLGVWMKAARRMATRQRVRVMLIVMPRSALAHGPIWGWQLPQMGRTRGCRATPTNFRVRERHQCCLAASPCSACCLCGLGQRQ